MKCVKCKKNAAIHLPNLHTCEMCFLRIIEKRVRKEIRTKSLIKKNDKILLIDDNSAESKVSFYLLKHIIKGLPVIIKVRKMKYTLGQEVKGFDKVIIPWSADKEGDYFLSNVFENKKMNYLGHYRNKKITYVKLLLHVLKKETEIFAKIKKFHYKIFTERTIASEMLDKLENEYPEVKFSLLRSTEYLKKSI
jgi:tRNA(Ile)-lysidine synthase TilS/MesJ